MRMNIGGLAAVLILGASLSGCAASMGAVAGNVVGGAAWGLMKGGGMAWKGGSFAARTAGKGAVGAAKGMRNEFSGRDGDADAGGAQDQGSDESALGNRVKDAAPVASAQGQAAALAY
jgi:hypothetical protein